MTHLVFWKAPSLLWSSCRLLGFKYNFKKKKYPIPHHPLPIQHQVTGAALWAGKPRPPSPHTSLTSIEDSHLHWGINPTNTQWKFDSTKSKVDTVYVYQKTNGSIWPKGHRRTGQVPITYLLLCGKWHAFLLAYFCRFLRHPKHFISCVKGFLSDHKHCQRIMLMYVRNVNPSFQREFRILSSSHTSIQTGAVFSQPAAPVCLCFSERVDTSVRTGMCFTRVP